jgi:hypothetical protein
MQTKFEQPTAAKWKELYELAVKLKELAPWEWMDETEIFGVENPETKEICFVSVMGMLGEHLSIGIYLGAHGLYGFWDFQEAGFEAEPFALFEIPQLQVSFENRDGLEKQDRDVIKKLDLKFRGARNYPLFRSIRPGFMPWFITSAEARVLIYVIEQALEVAPRVRENPNILDDERDTDNEVCLVRAAERQNGKLVWRDEMREIPPPDETEFIVDIPQALINELKAFPQKKNFVLEIDLFYAPTPIGVKGKRPYIPKMLMLADGGNGMIAGFQIIQPQEEQHQNYAEISSQVFDSLQKLNARPQEIRVADDLLFTLLKGVNQQLNIKIRQTDDLPAIEAAKEQMFRFFGGSLF